MEAKMKNNKPKPSDKVLRPYNIVTSDDGENAEITMYGEVVESVPVDWWTGEPMDGLFIVLEEFLNDLTLLAGKNITVRINSIGGDLNAGVAIYNRLKELGNVTTIVDGLAASAASIIAMAGGTRKVYQSSQVMIHSASVFVFDYLNINGVNEIKDLLESANKQVVAVYREASGLSDTKIKHMVEDTTWMVGQEIVDNGFADEVIEGSQIKMSLQGDRFICNGNPMIMRHLSAMPRNMEHTAAAADVNKVTQSAKHEEVNIMTVEELRQQYPDLVNEIEDKAKASVDTAGISAEAVAAERKRIEDIESIEASIKDKQLVHDAKYGENPMDAKDLALKAMQAQAKEDANQADIFLKNSAKDVAESGTDKVESDPEEPEEDETKDIAIAVQAVNSTKTKGVR